MISKSEIKDIFISHNWGIDNENRDNHKRCLELAELLIKNGYSVWIDEYDMAINIDFKIIEAINNSSIVLMCLTDVYCKKITYGISRQIIIDNCYKEWNYTFYKKKKIIPLLMEKDVLNSYWISIIELYLHNTYYIDMSNEIEDNILILKKQLIHNKIKTNKDKKKMFIKSFINKKLNIIKLFVNNKLNLKLLKINNK